MPSATTPRPIGPVASSPSRQRTPALRAVALCTAWLATSAQAITGSTSTTDFKNVGDGVQFAPNWVLTASHLGYGVNSSYSNGWGSSLVAAVYSAPGASFPDHDLMLLRLATPIAAAPTLQLSSTVFTPTALDWRNPSLSLDVTLASNDNATPGPRGYAFGQVRAFADTLLDDHDNNPATPSLLRTVNWLVTHSDSLGAPYVEGGDSGSGLFLGHVTDGTTPLLGIASAQFNNIDGPNTFASGYVSVASYRSWIDSTMLGDSADNQVANWVSTPVPEPATWALWLAGAGALGAWRRRRA